MNIRTRTYEEWKDLGYQVRKGQKAYGKNEAGYRVFSERQVFPIYKGTKPKKSKKK